MSQEQGGGGIIFKLGDVTISRGGRVHLEWVSFSEERLIKRGFSRD